MKEEIFENEYIMTKELFKEYVYNVLCKKVIILGSIISILGIIMFFVIQGRKAYEMIGMAFILGFTTLLTPIITVKQLEDTSKRLNNGKIEKTSVKFSNNIVMDEGKAHLEFEYNQINELVMTKNFIVLKISNQSAILVLKKGFVIGKEEEFLKFIKDKINN